MKYIVVLADGMADYSIKELGNKTPLQYACTPTFDFLAARGQVGRVKTIPDNMYPGSDTANLSILGYDPRLYYSGRSPYEALSLGVNLEDGDLCFRCNLVTLSEEDNFRDSIMLNHSAGGITSEESRELINAINGVIQQKGISFHCGLAYRHIMLWKDYKSDVKSTPPQDIIGKPIDGFIPKGIDQKVFLDIMKESNEILKNHSVNINRRKKGLKAANSIWLWAQGTLPRLPYFCVKYKVKSSVVSAVDLIKGIGILAGFRVINVDGATGDVNTNFLGKANAALEELKTGQDLVYIHIEAPDESSHNFELHLKVKAIELIDELIVKVIKEALDASKEEYKIMILPDHPTPLSIRTHTSEEVPFLIYNNTKEKHNNITYDEISMNESPLYIKDGYKLMDYFINS